MTKIDVNNEVFLQGNDEFLRKLKLENISNLHETNMRIFQGNFDMWNTSAVRYLPNKQDKSALRVLFITDPCVIARSDSK